MSLQTSDQQSTLHLLTKKSSWRDNTLVELEDQLGERVKPLGSMNLDEFLNNVFSAEVHNVKGLRSSLQHEVRIPLTGGFSSKAVDDVWGDIQGGKKRLCKEIKSENREMTLEDFLVKEGILAEEAPSGPSKVLDTTGGVATHCFAMQLSLSPSPSVGSVCDTPVSTSKRGAFDLNENNDERRLKRKIKNRESAARSRARKQAYHDELVSKVSLLQEENAQLKKEKEIESLLLNGTSSEPRYQLRRTSST